LLVASLCGLHQGRKSLIIRLLLHCQFIRPIVVVGRTLRRELASVADCQSIGGAEKALEHAFVYCADVTPFISKFEFSFEDENSQLRFVDVPREFIINDVGISIMTINAIAGAGSLNERIGSTRRAKLRAVPPVLSDGQDALDRALIGSIAAGDKRAMRVLYARHSVRIYRFIEHLIRNSSVAEDLVSDVFLDAWRHASRFEAKARLSTWLLAIARYKALSELRRRSHEQLDEHTTASIEDPADSPEITMQKTVHSAIIRKCLAQLSSAHREVTNLVYYQDKSIEEVAEIVGVPTSTIKTRMFYARRQLAKLLREEGVDGP
jgi:RNA polymerase sigma-70 factor (ECF subfamily)